MNPLRRQQVLEARAWLMRKAPTRSEAALWRLLSGGKLGAPEEALARVREALAGAG